MSAGVVLAVCSAVIELVVGLSFLALWSAPGWKRARIYTVMALSACWFSVNNVFFSMPEATDLQLRLADSMNYLLAGVQVAAWLLHAFADAEKPWRSASKRLRVLIGVTLALGALTFVGPLHFTGAWAVTKLTSFAVTYRVPEVTLFGQLVGVWDLVMIGLIYARYVRAFRRNERGATLYLAGFTVFYLCSIDEVLVSNGVIEFLTLGDLGFGSMVLVVFVQTLLRVIDDAQALERLAARVGHEIANPLTYVGSNLDLLREYLVEEKAPDDVLLLVDDAKIGADRITQAVRNLRAYARTGAQRAVSSPVASAGEPRILAIDDDETLLRSVARLLKPHQVLTCSNGAGALALLEKDKNFTLILCDIMMPGMSGPEVYRRLAAEHPSLTSRFMFMTGGAVDDDAREFLLNEGVRWMPKPIDKASLQALIRSGNV